MCMYAPLITAAVGDSASTDSDPIFPLGVSSTGDNAIVFSPRVDGHAVVLHRGPRPEFVDREAYATSFAITAALLRHPGWVARTITDPDTAGEIIFGGADYESAEQDVFCEPETARALLSRYESVPSVRSESGRNYVLHITDPMIATVGDDEALVGGYRPSDRGSFASLFAINNLLKLDSEKSCVHVVMDVYESDLSWALAKELLNNGKNKRPTSDVAKGFAGFSMKQGAKPVYTDAPFLLIDSGRITHRAGIIEGDRYRDDALAK